MMPRILIAAMALVALTAAVIFQSDPAQAWKPYTHNFTADFAYRDAVEDGMVTIDDREYPLNPRLVLALQQKPAHYNAGVVGPDGFPDSVYGQVVIHPANTGAWLQHTLNSAWAAQSDPAYTEDQKLEILAFSYGYLTHAAGDMWAHTLINDFAGGLADIFGGPASAGFTIKHLILEAYIGDATPGFDGNPDRNPVAGALNEDGDPDVSDDSTHGIAFAPPPDKFLYDVFIALGPDADGNLVNALPGQPTADRSKLLGFFYDLRNTLNDAAGTNTNIQEAIDSFGGLQGAIDDVWDLCFSLIPHPIACPEALLKVGLGTLLGFADAAQNLLAAAAEEIVDRYFAAWVEDIDYGLQHWSGVGMTFTTGLFDPQTLRDKQNEECGEVGSGEADAARAACEDAFGQLDTLTAVLDPYLTGTAPHLLSMVGAPDVALTVFDALSAISAFIDNLVDVPNPFEATIEELKAYIREKINDALAETLGFDPAVFAELLKNPTSYLDPVHSPLNLPPPLDALDNVGALFAAGEHERLDRYMGMQGEGLVDAHHDMETRRLDDDAEFIVSELGASDFIPIENTITTSKLLLLDGTVLNQVLTDQIGRPVATYPADGNFMITALGSSEPWLKSIDSDHAWRQDGLPDFCTEGVGTCLPATQDRPASVPRAAHLNGGTGQMPVWESCVLRPAFRSLYRDWQNGDEQFPDFFDAPSADPGSDPNAPKSSLAFQGISNDNAGRKFVSNLNLFTVTAVDTLSGPGFPDSAVTLQYRISTQVDPALRGPFIDIRQGGHFRVTGADGRYFVDVRSADPCHTFADENGPDFGDPMPPEAFQTFEYWLDTTPPIVTCDNPPFGRSFDTDDISAVDFEVADGVNGAGVAGFYSTIDGFLLLGVPIADGAALDMYKYYPGTRTVWVAAADKLGNPRIASCRFEIHATTDSLLSNLARARTEGKITGPASVYNSLRTKLVNADTKHDQGQHSSERTILNTFIQEMRTQRGRYVDVGTANRLMAFAQDLIDRRG